MVGLDKRMMDAVKAAIKAAENSSEHQLLIKAYKIMKFKINEKLNDSIGQKDLFKDTRNEKESLLEKL